MKTSLYPFERKSGTKQKPKYLDLSLQNPTILLSGLHVRPANYFHEMVRNIRFKNLSTEISAVVRKVPKQIITTDVTSSSAIYLNFTGTIDAEEALVCKSLYFLIIQAMAASKRQLRLNDAELSFAASAEKITTSTNNSQESLLPWPVKSKQAAPKM